MIEIELVDDEPFSSEALDRLHFSPFAAKLLPHIVPAGRQSPIVLGLYAPWGYGKSTLLEFLTKALEGKSTGTVPIVVTFNPWLYGTTESLLAAFFGSIAVKMGTAPLLSRAARKDAADAVRKLGKVVNVGLSAAAGFPIPETFTGTAVDGVAFLLQGGEEKLDKAREKARKALKAMSAAVPQQRLVVLIDDVDRAERAEVMALIRLIRLVADLPNTTYVLAMDNRRVARVISASYSEEEGHAYLEKVVGASIYVPPAPRATMREVLSLEVRGRMERVDLGTLTLWQGASLGNATVEEAMLDRIRSFRDVKRYLNGLALALSGQERPPVHADDVALLTFLQVFYPEVYERVRFQRGLLTAEPGAMDRRPVGATPEVIEQFRRENEARVARVAWPAFDGQGDLDDYAAWSRVPSEHRTPLRLLIKLFPNARIPGQTSDENRREQRRTNRIATWERFDRYFRLVPLPNELEDAVVEGVLHGLVVGGDPSPLLERLRPIDGVLSPEAIERLRDRIGTVPRQSYLALVNAILDAQSYFGEQVVGLLDTLITWKGKQLVEEGRPDPAVGEASELVAVTVTRLDDAGEAILIAGEYVRVALREDSLGPLGIQAIAQAGIARAERVVAQGGSPLALEPPQQGASAVWRWRDLRKAIGQDAGPIRDHLQRFVAEHPEMVWRGVALSAPWGAKGPHLLSGDTLDVNPSEYLLSLDSIVGVEQLMTLIVNAQREGIAVPDPFGLIPPFVEMARRERGQT